MRHYLKFVIIMCCLMWPTAADLCDFQPVADYGLPADIMRAEFADETWIYRLYEDGTVKKVTSKGTCPDTPGGRETANGFKV
ncbi:MAG: hypothetical protein HWN68_01100 [Desulfobacterales bacterium]|nr:hypothetical protein [Desulfobacterales bacterium]